jgi:hypothetical protein
VKKNDPDIYVILEVTPEQAAGVPQITHILKKAGVLKDLIDFLRGSSDPLAKAYLVIYDSLTFKQRQAAPIEAICVKAGIDTEKFFATVAGAVFSQTRHTAELMAAAAQPDVVQATVDAALDPRGKVDRKMLHQHSGFLPIPKTQIVSMPGARIDARSQTNQTVVLPPVEDGVKKMSNRFNERFLGEAKLPAEEVIEAEFEESDE